MIYAAAFRNAIKDWGKTSHIGLIFTHLFSFKTDEELNSEIKYLYELQKGEDSFFKENGINDWFGIWHKSIRQTDFFDNCFKKSHFSLITPEEEKEFRFLNDKVTEKGYNKKGINGQMFSDEYRRYLDLHERRKRQLRDESINGHLDSILWNMVHVDNDGEFFRVFKRVFLEIEFQLESTKVKK